MNFSVIIFCYNEEGNLPHVISTTLELLHEIMQEFEIIIINDGSTDNTNQICKNFAKQSDKIIVVTHTNNEGIGLALKSGYSLAKYEYVCAIPGDGQFDVQELRKITTFSTDTFYSFYRQQTSYSLYRSFLSWSNRLFNQHILGVYLRDVNWIKVYHKKHFRMVQPKLKSSLIESEICAKLYKLGIMPIEIPSHYLLRNSGESKGGSWRTLKKAISELFRLWWVVVRFKS